MAEAYKIFWQDETGTSYVSLTDSLDSGSVILETQECAYAKAPVTGEIPEAAAAEEASVFEASASEYAALTQKYGTVKNTGISSVEITAKPGEEITLPETITASYSDGSTKNLGVIWRKMI